jgi:DNA gyrase/topoisomerase IV subunit A
VQPAREDKIKGRLETSLHEEVAKRYLAYALSTIVARALPDVRDGLKPVHRRILYAMHAMGLGEAAKMRKSAAVVGEVIGKYHPHGDQAAYDALVRMAQDFSLRYPLVEGSGNFGSVDGDSPAAMRYTETRLSAFASLLLREIDQGTTAFRPTYDGMGQEPDVAPAGVPNLLLNGSSGIAVGMSCSFPPHNLIEVVAACRAAIKDSSLDSRKMLRFIKGPDFPTAAEIVDEPGHLAEIYATGHGSIRVRGTYKEEPAGRGRQNLIIDSIPYSVNKSRLIERIAQLIKDKKLPYVFDVRDESTAEIRIVLELRGAEVRPESVMAFLYKHTDLQINFPVNFIAITPQGVPERLGLDRIIRYFLEFRYEKITQRLEHRLAILQKRIHVLEGFRLLFTDLDRALKIIRSARSRQEAAQGLKDAFALDDEQTDAILDMRLYKLVGMEIGKVLDELAAKKREAEEIGLDLASPERLWAILDRELAEIARKFGDARRTQIMAASDASAVEYNPEEFVEHEDATVILSKQGWIRRMKSEVGDSSTLKFREGDSLFGFVRVNTGNTIAIVTNLGKIYVVRALDIPATTGFGEPLGNLLSMADGECVVGFAAPDPANCTAREDRIDQNSDHAELQEEGDQCDLFQVSEETCQPQPSTIGDVPGRGVLVTREGKGFRFEFGILREPSKRAGRRLVNLVGEDEIVAVKPEDGTLLAVASSSGKVLVFPIEQVPTLSGPGQGVRIISLKSGESVVSAEVVSQGDMLLFRPSQGKEKTLRVESIPHANRATQGKEVFRGIDHMERISGPERQIHE